MLDIIIVIIYSFLAGTIPTAYYILKKNRNLDIRNEGSGNVGAMNTYEVSGSKSLGFLVFLVDFLKGLAAVYLTKMFFDASFILCGISMLAVTAGHCFNPWLKFKGGRGLATAAGAAVYLAPLIILIWAVFWVIGFIFKKNIHFANIAATLLTGILSATSGDIINKYSIPPAQSTLSFTIFFGILMALILVKHYGPIKSWLKFNISSKGDSKNETV